MYWDMTRKMRDHPELEAGETAIEAVYGLGRAMLAAADSVSGRGGDARRYSRQFDRATGGPQGAGRASAISGNGVLALTDRRLLFFRKRFVIGAPRHLVASFPLLEVVACHYDRPMLVVELADGSVAALHVPRSQKPEAFVAALNGRAGGALST